MTKNSKRETIIDEDIDLEDDTYQEIINEINGTCKHLTLEINKLIKQVEILTDEERWTKEKARREAQIISFRGAQIPRFEADILQEMEEKVDKQFRKVDMVGETDYMFMQQIEFSEENQRITEIGLSLCLLTTLPESIGNLTSLQLLFLIRNKLRTLPESIGDLKSLQHLGLMLSPLMTLPESIGNLKSLQKLELCNNELTTLSVSIGNLKSLQTLDLWGNQLTSLPESIGNLKSLSYLDLHDNQLTSLPESIGNLKSLSFLNLRENQLTTLPESISKLTTLKRLNLSNNPLARKLDSRTKSILKRLKKNNIDFDV